MAHLQADYHFKLIIIGDVSVGKTSIVRRITDNEFSPNYVATIGVDFRLKKLTVRNKSIAVQIWDTAGQDRYQATTTVYLRGAKGVLVVYDITSDVSFQNVKKWVRQFRRVTRESSVSMLIGNKCDKNTMRQVPKDKAEQVAKGYGMLFAETSAKTGKNVDSAFRELVTAMVDKHRMNQHMGQGCEEAYDTVDITQYSETSSKCC